MPARSKLDETGYWTRTRPGRNALVRYAVAALAVVAAAVLKKELLAYVLSPAPVGFFYIAIAVAGWYGGLGPGLFATLLSLIANYIIFDLDAVPRGELALDQALRLALLAIGGTAMSYLSEALHRERRAVETAARDRLDLERRRREAEIAGWESEQRFRVASDAAPVMIWVSGPEGGYRHVNRAWLEFTGREMEQELGEGWQASVHPQDLAARRGLYAASVETRQPFRTEYRLRRHDGEYRWILERGAPRFDLSGVFAGFVGSCMDIEEQKRVSEDRERLLAATQQALADAAEAGRQRDEFLATMSHELRNPLNAIVGWAHVLQGASLEESERQRAVDSVLRSARAQARLVDDLLDVSRIIAGKLRLKVEVVDLNGIVESAVESVAPTAEAKGVRIQTLLQAGDPVLGDAVRLQQVVSNLLDNAVKFTPSGGRVQVSTQRPDSHIELVVSDTGQGMPPEFVPHVFDLFRQEEAGSRRRHGGLGLGLAIARQIVEMHAGTIKAESGGTDQGSTFTVTLPVALLAPSRAASLARPEPRPDEPCVVPGLGLTGVTVLVLEDDADTRELLRLILEECGARVLVCGTVGEAMAALERELPTVILSDIEMPEEDGYDFMRRLRALPAERGGNLPAAALTAYARGEDRRRALASGFQLHAAKPIEPAELATIVANLAGRAPGTPA